MAKFEVAAELVRGLPIGLIAATVAERDSVTFSGPV